jgi:hypothetical protein
MDANLPKTLKSPYDMRYGYQSAKNTYFQIPSAYAVGWVPERTGPKVCLSWPVFKSVRGLVYEPGSNSCHRTRDLGGSVRDCRDVHIPAQPRWNTHVLADGLEPQPRVCFQTTLRIWLHTLTKNQHACHYT